MQTRIQPDRAALELAHRALRTNLQLDAMLAVRTYEVILMCLARRHMQRRSRVDVRKLQANDQD